MYLPKTYVPILYQGMSKCIPEIKHVVPISLCHVNKSLYLPLTAKI